MLSTFNSLVHRSGVRLYWAVMVVQWSACPPSAPNLSPAGYKFSSLSLLCEKTKLKEKEAGKGLFKSGYN